MSQENDIWSHLYKYGSITPLEALNLYGCFRLASRINEMRQQGLNISTVMVENNGKRYAKYVLNNKC